ncbi:MAG: hypothetical protein OSA97_07345 [Nevskia sp.]|nr:hypothetical protein [Nevskia sp.]
MLRIVAATREARAPSRHLLTGFGHRPMTALICAILPLPPAWIGRVGGARRRMLHLRKVRFGGTVAGGWKRRKTAPLGHSALLLQRRKNSAPYHLYAHPAGNDPAPPGQEALQGHLLKINTIF